MVINPFNIDGNRPKRRPFFHSGIVDLGSKKILGRYTCILGKPGPGPFSDPVCDVRDIQYYNAIAHDVEDEDVERRCRSGCKHPGWGWGKLEDIQWMLASTNTRRRKKAR
jgi:hypothetical protein